AALEHDLAARGLEQARDGPQRGALACAVGADQGHYLGGHHAQVHAVQRRGPAVAHVQVAQLQHGRSRLAACQPAGVRFTLLEDRAHAFLPPPRYASTTLLSDCTWAGVPSASFWPKWITTTRSDTPITSPMLCSTIRIDSTSVPRTVFRISPNWRASWLFRPAAGSSSIRISGLAASASATSSRRSSPHDSTEAGASMRCAKPMVRTMRSALSRAAASATRTARPGKKVRHSGWRASM